MSTVENETDIGPNESDTDTEGTQYLKTDNDRPTEGSTDGDLPPSIVGILEDVRHEEQGEEDRTFSSRFSTAYGNTLDQEEQESSDVINGDVLASPGKERPSSADGSFSIPDDTPSVQVHTPASKFLLRDTDQIELNTLIDREISSHIRPRIQSVPISSTF